jgi:transposase InsO family protein
VDQSPTLNQHRVREGGGVLYKYHPPLWDPNSIITDNGMQFTGKKFLDFGEGHHIRVDWATVAHPMTNGQVDRANGIILQGLKPRIYNDLNKFGKQ